MQFGIILKNKTAKKYFYSLRQLSCSNRGRWLSVKITGEQEVQWLYHFSSDLNRDVFKHRWPSNSDNTTLRYTIFTFIPPTPFSFYKVLQCISGDSVICHWNVQVSEDMRWPWTSCYGNFKCSNRQSKKQLTFRTKFIELFAKLSKAWKLGWASSHNTSQVIQVSRSKSKHWELTLPNFRNTFTFKMWVLCNIMHNSRVWPIQNWRETWAFSLSWNIEYVPFRSQVWILTNQ